MKEIQGNIWDYHTEDSWVVITTNGYVKANGEAVMGAGVAKQAAERFPDLPEKLGKKLKRNGNFINFFPEYRIVTLPVKNNWWERASLDLIHDSLQDLRRYIDGGLILKEGDVYMVRPGCGNGDRSWDVVRGIVSAVLDCRVTVVEKNHTDEEKTIQDFWNL